MSRCNVYESGHIFNQGINIALYSKAGPIISSSPPSKPDRFDMIEESVCACGEVNRKIREKAV